MLTLALTPEQRAAVEAELQQAYIKKRSRIVKSGCWEWIGSCFTCNGYSQAKWRGKNQTGHRLSYQAFNGIIAEGQVLHHLCRNRRCVNPDHLRPVSHRANILLGLTLPARNAQKTHCKRGHALFGPNLRVNKRGSRICRECMRLHDRKHKAKTRKDPSPLMPISHCKRGHEFTPENTYQRNGVGPRTCVQCRRIRAKIAYWDRRGSTA